MSDFYKMAMEMVKEQAGVRTMTATEMVEMVKEVAAGLQGVMTGEVVPTAPEVTPQEPAVDPKKSITANYITCIECGKKARVLTSKHLATHGLTAVEYKEKWGIPAGTSLIAKSLGKERAEKMKSMKLWERRGKNAPAAPAAPKAPAVKKRPKAAPAAPETPAE